jgi:hypothetical protein
MRVFSDGSCDKGIPPRKEEVDSPIMKLHFLGYELFVSPCGHLCSNMYNVWPLGAECCICLNLGPVEYCSGCKSRKRAGEQ